MIIAGKPRCYVTGASPFFKKILDKLIWFGIIVVRQKNMLITCKKLSEMLRIDYLQASSLLKVLTTKGIATEADTNKTNKRGRPTIIYKIPSSININLSTGKISEPDKCQNTM